MEGVINISDNFYPKLLKKIVNPPKKLFYKGTLDLTIFRNCLAVVGSRRMSAYGKYAVKQISSKFYEKNIVIVSGFMYGIDAEAHKNALDNKLRTIAVMPCGVDVVHPSCQKDLYNKILDSGGLFLSEFENGFLPRNWTYPKRNRIVAGISKAVLVVEAALNSGSLITAGFAKEFKRKLFAVPGPINVSNSQGVLHLIKEHAEVVIDGKEIVKFFNKNIGNSLKSSIPECTVNKDFFDQGDEESVIGNDLITSVLFSLESDQLTIDELSERLLIPVSTLNSEITKLVLSEKIYEQEGRYYVNKG